MAPRGRPRKPRDRRMDAAVDAMTKNYGFPEETVKRIANILLKEYEGDQGDEGWYFIEDCSYQVLVDALLQDQELNDGDNAPPNRKEDTLPETVSLQNDKAEKHALADAVTPSGVLTETNCSKVVENEMEKSIKEDADQIPPTGRDGRGWKDIGLDESSSQKERTAGISDENELCVSSPDHASSLILAPPSLATTTPLVSCVTSPPEKGPVLSPFPKISPLGVKSVQSKRRQPCNGWIFESDEEEDGDMIDLKPAIEREDLSWGAVKAAKRRSRWDLRPEDI